MTNTTRTNKLSTLLMQILTEESGQDLIEYALVAAIIALGATAAMNSVTTATTGAFTKIGSSLTSAV